MEETTEAPIKEPISTYSISEEYFLKHPAQLERYIPGGKITRENFMNFYINSFAHSRGVRSVQMARLEWEKIHTGFDYIDTYQNLRHDTNKKFTKQELQLLIDFINRIPRHTELGVLPKSTPESTVRLIVGDILEITTPTSKVPSFIDPEELKKLDWNEFNRLANDEIKAQMLQRGR